MKSLLTLTFLLCCLSLNARRHYVNINANGLNNGTSWANAFNELSVPIDTYPGDTFWVANGTYTSHNGEPWAFHVMDSTVLYGGFDASETVLSQRNFSGFNTIIAGTNTYGTNIYVQGGVGKEARIDGFRITHTLGYGQQTQSIGLLITGSFALANCLITDVWNPLPVYVNSVNLVNISNCQFVYNGHATVASLPAKGAVLTVNGIDLTVTNCLFKNNESPKGGAVSFFPSSKAVFNRCVFYGNNSRAAGGAIFDSSANSFRILNSLFVGNKAQVGAAHYGTDSLNGKRSFVHCTFAHNLATQVGANNYTLWLNGTKDTLLNSILWGDSSGTGNEIPNKKGSSFFSRNLIEKGTTISGTIGTITANPMFVSPGTAAGAPFGTTTSFNYHLSALSDAVDSGSNLALSAPFNVDLEGNARAQGFAPDLGAYEWKTCSWVNTIITPSGPTNFCIPDSVRLTASANPVYNHVYQWNGGTSTATTITVKTTGYNKVVVVDSTGCRSAAGVMVNAVATPSPVISRTGNTLSVPATFATYQWYRGSTLIAGATSSSYTTTVAAQYTVRVTTTLAACPGVSTAFNFTPVGVGSVASNVSLNISPNPVEGQIHLKLESAKGSTQLRMTLCNLTGAVAWSSEFHQVPAQFETTRDLSELAKGVYVLTLEGDDFREVRKLLLK